MTPRKRTWDESSEEQEQDKAPPPAAIRQSPDEWRKTLNMRASKHACAAQLHGWRLHEHHEGVPMQLTEAAYLEAVEAAQKPSCVPSPNAVSPHLGKGL